MGNKTMKLSSKLRKEFDRLVETENASNMAMMQLLEANRLIIRARESVWKKVKLELDLTKSDALYHYNSETGEVEEQG